MKRIIAFVLVSFVLVSCSRAAPTPDPALLAAQTEMVQMKAQISALQSATPVIIIQEITQTLTPTPIFTPTITNTPAPTNTPSPTSDPLKRAKGDGFYLVGVDIAPGVWRSSGTGNRCYWAVTRANGDIIDNHFGMSGGTAYVSTAGFQVQFESCGIWTFVQDP
jgi:hypothetical protein